MTTRTTTLIASAALLGGLFALTNGCATATPSGQLIDARRAYAASNSGLAAKLAPTELYDAKKVLDKANQEFADHGDSLECRDYAYIASRKLELADVKARTALDRQKIAEAVKAGVVVRDSQVKTTQIALASSRNELTQERADNATATSQLRAVNREQGKANFLAVQPAGRWTSPK